MSAYRKFSASFEAAESDTLGGLGTLDAGGSNPKSRPTETLGTLGGLGGTHPSIRREDRSRIEPPTPPKVPKAPKVTGIGDGHPNLSRYARVFAALCERCPDHVEPGRWQHALED